MRLTVNRTLIQLYDKMEKQCCIEKIEPTKYKPMIKMVNEKGAIFHVMSSSVA